MAASDEPLIALRTAARSRLALVALPFLLLPATVWATWWALNHGLPAITEQPPSNPWTAYAAVAALHLVFPLWALASTRLGARYVVTIDRVSETRGILSRASSDVRIADVRNIVVVQSFLDRLLGIGTVSFSSAAGDATEVTFREVAAPERVRVLVRDIQDKLSSGALTDDERAAIIARARAQR